MSTLYLPIMFTHLSQLWLVFYVTGHRLLCQVLMFFLCANLEAGDQILLQSLILKRILMSWFVHLFLISKKLFFIFTTIWLYLIVNCLLHLIVLIIFHISILQCLKKVYTFCMFTNHLNKNDLSVGIPHILLYEFFSMLSFFMKLAKMNRKKKEKLTISFFWIFAFFKKELFWFIHAQLPFSVPLNTW